MRSAVAVMTYRGADFRPGAAVNLSTKIFNPLPTFEFSAFIVPYLPIVIPVLEIANRHNRNQLTTK